MSDIILKDRIKNENIRPKLEVALIELNMRGTRLNGQVMYKRSP